MSQKELLRINPTTQEIELSFLPARHCEAFFAEAIPIMEKKIDEPEQFYDRDCHVASLLAMTYQFKVKSNGTKLFLAL